MTTSLLVLWWAFPRANLPAPVPGTQVEPRPSVVSADDEPALRKKASNALDCAAWSLRVADQLDTRVIVSGCGRGALYEHRGSAWKLLTRW